MSSLSKKKKPVIINNSVGRFSLLDTRLGELGIIGTKPLRWVRKSDLKGLKSGKTKHIRLWYGIGSSIPVSVTLFAKEKQLSIGCVEFYGKEVTQIMEWINRKGK